MAIPTEYDFVQQVDYPDILTANIQASSISTTLSYISTVGSGPTMAVAVWFSDILSDADITTLNSVMAAYVNQLSPLQQHLKQILIDMNFGMQIIAQFGAANRVAELTTSQVIQIAQQLAPVQSLLMSGSIETALVAIQSITPNAIITLDVINYYAQELQNYLNGQ